MDKTTFRIPQMDCHSEENMVRMKLDDLEAVKALDFDLPDRKLVVYHVGQISQIEASVKDLNLGASLEATEQAGEEEEEIMLAESASEKKLLWIVLSINFIFFIVEMTAGLISNSMGLVADSLDMLADALVYALSLYAVGKAVSSKKRVAIISGYFQITLAIIGFVEVLRRFFGFEELPDFQTMIIVSFLALLANSYALYILQKAQNKEAHMQASMIFTSNDIIINIGVILAGVLVYFTGSSIPDLVIGGIVFLIVTRGAIRILKLGK